MPAASAAAGTNNGADPGRRAERAMRTSVLAIVVSVVLAAGKLAAGVIGHSFALIADGVESMLDVVSASVVWGGLRIAATPPDEKHPYGHGKAESMAALVVAVTSRIEDSIGIVFWFASCSGGLAPGTPCLIPSFGASV